MVKHKNQKDITTIFDRELLLEEYRSHEGNNIARRIEVAYMLTKLGYVKDSEQMIKEIRRVDSYSIYSDLNWYKANLNIAFKKNDKYLQKKIVSKILEEFDDEEEFYYDLLMNQDVEFQKSIFEQSILPELLKLGASFRIPKSKYKMTYYLCYLQYLAFEEDFNPISWIDRNISRFVKNIDSGQLTIHELEILINYVGIILIAFRKSNSLKKLPVSIDAIKKFIELGMCFLRYFIGDRRVNISELIIESCNLIFKIEENNEYFEIGNQFILDNEEYLSESYKYISRRMKSQGNVNVIDYIEKSIAEGKYIDVVRICISEYANENYENVIELGKFITQDNSDVNNALTMLVEYAKYIEYGEPMSENTLEESKRYFALPQLMYDSQLYLHERLSYNDFVEKLGKTERFALTNKELLRLIEVFKSVKDSGWLIQIVKKYNYDGNRNTIFKTILDNLFNKALYLKYTDFDNLLEPMVESSENCYVLLDILTIYMTSDRHSYVAKKTFLKLMSISESEKLSRNPKFESIVFNYLVALLSFDDFEESESIIGKLNELINSVESQSKYLMKYVVFLKENIIAEEEYEEILRGLFEISKMNADDYSDVQIRLIGMLNAEILMNPQVVEMENDKLFLVGDEFAGKNFDGLKDIYQFFNISEIHDSSEIGSEAVLSLLGLIITRITFKNPTKFGLKPVPINENSSAEEILKEMDKLLNPQEVVEMKKELLNGKGNQLLLNAFPMHYLFKMIQNSSNNKINMVFNRITNDLMPPKMLKLIHPVSMILLAVIKGLKIVKDNDLCLVTGEFYDDIVEKYTLDIGDLADGIMNENVYIDDSLKDLCESLMLMKNQNRIIYPLRGRIYMGMDSSLNLHDEEIVKVLIENERNNYVLITDDKFYHDNKSFKNVVGVYSLIVEAFVNEIIDEQELLRLTSELNSMKYNSLFSNNIVFKLVEMHKKTKSEELSEALRIINKNTKINNE